ncbi:MAG: acyl--CoA ligase [Burkholderiales bacterium]|nr:acyl--CoA ligase [Burkholderiales bacterium]
MTPAALSVDAIVDAVAASRGTAIAVVTEAGEEVSYAQLAQRIGLAADALRSAGLRAGDRVLLVAENCLEMIVALFATLRCDAWAVPINARLSAAEVDAIRKHAQPRLCIYASTVSEPARAHAQRAGALQHGLPGIGVVALSAADEAVQPEPAAESAQSQVAVVIYTSGSTGSPKGVMLTHAGLRYLADTSAALGTPGPSDRVYFALPMSHSYGLTTVMLCTLAAGGCLLPVARFSADQLAAAIRDDGITIFQGVPAMYARLLEWAAASGARLAPNRLRMCYIGGSMIDKPRKAAAEALLGQRLHHGYGLTEAGPTVTRTLGGEAPSDASIGLPFPGVEVSLRGAAGRAVAPGEEGELWVRGPNLMKGYYRDPVQTRETIDADGWLHTGDLACQGPGGELRIAGRIKELIIHGGFNVYPAEVEAAIAAFPGIAQCAVLGYATGGDEEIVAFIEPQAGKSVSLAELERFLRERLAPYKIPRRWRVMERLPASGTGKLLKAAMRGLIEESTA